MPFYEGIIIIHDKNAKVRKGRCLVYCPGRIPAREGLNLAGACDT